MIRFWCQCGRQLQSSENMIGELASCPLCRRITIVPESDMPRTADFPPVPPPKTRINEFGEITRGEGVSSREMPAPTQPATPERPVSGWALAAGMLGGLSVFCLMGPLTGIPALIAGVVALRDRRVQSGELRGKGSALVGLALASLGIIIWLGLFPAVAKVRQAAERMKEADNLKQIGQALHNFHDTYGYFPAATAFRTKDGKPGLSWRLAIVPFFGGENLSRRFNYDEPWDSPTNKALLPEMFRCFLRPDQPDDGRGLTHYQVFVGPGTVFEDLNKQQGINPLILPRTPMRGITLPSITDGTSNTILVAVAKNPVPWTKPDDLDFDPAKPLPPLDDRFGGYRLLLADGSVRTVSKQTGAATLRAWITRNGGETVSLP